MDYLEEIAGATSVKRIGVVRRPTAEKFGVAHMKNRPVFSVFDYGTIEPPVPLDNSTIALMAAYNFDMLEKEGIDTHYWSLVDDDGNAVAVDDVLEGLQVPDTLEVHYVNRVLPEFNEERKEWDYSMFQNPEVNNFILPIEFIWRGALPESSSVWRRIEKGEITRADLGIPENLKPGDALPKPLFDYSTKFEPDDRYLSAEKARELMGVSDEEFKKMKQIVYDVNEHITNHAKKRGFDRLDSKIEIARVQKRGVPTYMVADAAGTWHEDRIQYQDFGISKQRIRDKIKQLNPEWYAGIQQSKERAKKEGYADFRTLMDPAITYTSPSGDFFERTNDLFQAATNQWVGEKVYDVFPSRQQTMKDDLEQAIEAFQKVA